MGFYRQGQPAALTRTQVVDLVTITIAAQDLGFVSRSQDPFGIDDPCNMSPSGMHQPFASCGEVVCFHCAKVFWR